MHAQRKNAEGQPASLFAKRYNQTGGLELIDNSKNESVYSLRIRALIKTLYVTIVASILFAIVGYQIRTNLENNVRDHVSSSAGLLSKYTARSLDNIHFTIKHLAQQIEYEWARGFPPSSHLRPVLKRSIKDLHHVRSMNVISHTGYLIADSLTIHRNPIFLGDRDYFTKNRHTKKAQFYISKPTLGRITGDWMVSASYRFNKISGQFGGVVSAVIDPLSFQKIFKEKIEEEIDYAIVDDTGLVYFHSLNFFGNNQLSIGSFLKNPELLPKLDHKVFEDELFPFVEKSIQSLSSVAGYDNLYILTKTSHKIITKEWNEQLLSLFILYIAFILASYYYFLTLTQKERQEKEAQRLQQDSENRFRILAENATDVISMHYIDGRFMYVSPSCLTLTGYTKEELFEMKELSMFIKEQYLKQIFSRFKNIFQEKEVKRFRYEIIDKEGKTHWFESSARLVSDSGFDQKYMIVIVTRNIDETVKFENQLQIANKKIHDALLEAQSGSLAKTQFLATMSHELRTPLNAIIGFSEMIARQEHGEIHPKYLEYINYVKKSGDDLLQIISDILNLSKIETGRIELDKKPIDLTNLVKECCQMMTSNANQADIVIKNKINKKCPKIIADDHAIKQVFTNLLSNAIKFTPSGGEIKLEQLLDDNGFNLIVSDTGIGIAEKDLQIILEPFTQIEQAHAIKQSGIGLGLPIVKALIELHDGHIHLESTINVGTKVTVTFPEKVIIQ